MIYALIGMGMGIHMGASGDHSLFPAHAHLNLLGWVSMALYGFFYKAYPAATDRLGTIHFWLANLGVIVMIPAVVMILKVDESYEWLVIIGSDIVILSMALFAIIVFRATRSA